MGVHTLGLAYTLGPIVLGMVLLMRGDALYGVCCSITHIRQHLSCICLMGQCSNLLDLILCSMGSNLTATMTASLGGMPRRGALAHCCVQSVRSVYRSLFVSCAHMSVFDPRLPGLSHGVLGLGPNKVFSQKQSACLRPGLLPRTRADVPTDVLGQTL